MSELQAIGTFEVKMAPIDTADPGIGGMTLAKTYAGDLHAEAVGQMLAMRTTDGSAGYVRWNASPAVWRVGRVRLRSSIRA